MANLAIKGHSTRGSEVIALLEMLGGKNPHKYTADCESLYFYIDGGTNNIYYDWANNPKESSKCLFTLEEFEEKLSYKVGNKVCFSDSPNHCLTIKKIWWNNDCNDLECTFYEDDIDVSIKDLQPYKKETMERKYNVEEYLKVWEETEKGLEVVVNDNFELKEDNGKFYIIKKQPKYPKTYEECCEVIGYNIIGATIIGYKTDVLRAFQKLLICRDAYWKIAGEQMGLGKPWEPDWDDEKEFKYGLYYFRNGIMQDGSCINSTFLAFPTEEMRDAFYENFKELIESCKELL